jgi:hypothetical protein
MPNIVACRARIAQGCTDGKPTLEEFGEDLPLEEDGTYQDGSIICNSCYIRLMPHTPSGQGLLHELPAAIQKFHNR